MKPNNYNTYRIINPSPDAENDSVYGGNSRDRRGRKIAVLLDPAKWKNIKETKIFFDEFVRVLIEELDHYKAGEKIQEVKEQTEKILDTKKEKKKIKSRLPRSSLKQQNIDNSWAGKHSSRTAKRILREKIQHQEALLAEDF